MNISLFRLFNTIENPTNNGSRQPEIITREEVQDNYQTLLNEGYISQQQSDTLRNLFELDPKLHGLTEKQFNTVLLQKQNDPLPYFEEGFRFHSDIQNLLNNGIEIPLVATKVTMAAETTHWSVKIDIQKIQSALKEQYPELTYSEALKHLRILEHYAFDSPEVFIYNDGNNTDLFDIVFGRLQSNPYLLDELSSPHPLIKGEIQSVHGIGLGGHFAVSQFHHYSEPSLQYWIHPDTGVKSFDESADSFTFGPQPPEIILESQGEVLLEPPPTNVPLPPPSQELLSLQLTDNPNYTINILPEVQEALGTALSKVNLTDDKLKTLAQRIQEKSYELGNNLYIGHVTFNPGPEQAFYFVLYEDLGNGFGKMHEIINPRGGEHAPFTSIFDPAPWDGTPIPYVVDELEGTDFKQIALSPYTKDSLIFTPENPETEENILQLVDVYPAIYAWLSETTSPTYRVIQDISITSDNTGIITLVDQDGETIQYTISEILEIFNGSAGPGRSSGHVTDLIPYIQEFNSTPKQTNYDQNYTDNPVSPSYHFSSHLFI